MSHNALRKDVEEHGEIHATLEGRDEQLEIRKGQVEWNTPTFSHFTITAFGKEHRFRYTKILDWDLPQEIWAD